MSRKLTVTLVFFIFLLPFVSWYYLRSGLEWRKNVQAVMNGKRELPELPFRSRAGIPLEKSQLENHVSLVVLVSCDSLSSQMDLVKTLYLQFKDTQKANFLFVDTCQLDSFLLPDTLKESIYTLQCNDTLASCDSLLDNWSPGSQFALVDRHGIVRAYYTARNHDEKKMLVEHMAILIPRDYTEKVQLKRDAEKQ
jgi:hypothetical protein